MASTASLSTKELRILTSNASRTVLDGLAPAFESATGRRYAVEFDSAKTMLARIDKGETGDIVILGASVVAGLEKRGVVRTGSCRVFARSRVGVAVRAGAPKPDISSAAALRRALLDARSIAHTVHGASGMYMPVLLQRLGIADEVKHKVVTRPGGYIGAVVASGEAEIAVQQIVELLAVPGIELVGPLPDEVQQVFRTAAGIFTASTQPDAAVELISFLCSPASTQVFTDVGLEQAAS